MSIDQVSTIKQTQPGLYQCISELKKLIIATGTVECQETSCGEDNRSKIKTLLDSPQNGNGEFYRYWFDEESEDEWVDPVGNNIILLAIARGAFNNTDRDSVVVPMVSAILDDLASKIKSPELLSEIVSFKCRTEKCYYDNSPLTIAINSGMIDIACRLLEMGSDANVTCYGKSGKEEGKYTAAHLVILRLPFVENPSKELKVLELLKLYKADFKAQDNFGRSVEDLVKTHNLHIEDMKLLLSLVRLINPIQGKL